MALSIASELSVGQMPFLPGRLQGREVEGARLRLLANIPVGSRGGKVKRSEEEVMRRRYNEEVQGMRSKL